MRMHINIIKLESGLVVRGVAWTSKYFLNNYTSFIRSRNSSVDGFRLIRKKT